MKKKRVLSLFLAAMLSLTAITGCSGSGKTADSQAAGSEGATQAAGAGEKKALKVWLEKVFSDDANASLQKRVEQFAAEKGVDVQFEFLSATDFVPKLNAAIEAGSNIPDITLTSGNRALNYYPNIPNMDVTELVAEINSERPYFDSVFEGAKYDGVNYFVPFLSSTCLMFVRTDILKENGITEYPKTWDEVFTVAEKVSDPANGIYGLGIGCGPTDEDCENTFRTILWNYGAYLFDEEGNAAVPNDRTKALIEKYADLYKKEIIPPSATTWDPGGNNATYLMGESAIVFNAPTLYNALKSDEAYKEIFENTAALNMPDGTDNSQRMGFITGWSVMSSCKDTDTAKDFIKYMLDKEWQDSYLEITAPVFAPLFKDAKENEFWKEGVNAQVVAYAENAGGYYGYPSKTLEGKVVGNKHYFTYPVAELLNSVVTGASTPDKAMEKMKADIEEISASIK